jgi:chromosome segregation ATPase
MSEKEASNVLTSENSEAFYANRLGLADEAPVEADPVEETPESEPIEEAEEQSGQKSDEIKAPEEKKPNPKLEKRFSELTKQREDARKEAQREREQRKELESRLKELEQKVNPAPVQTSVNEKPQPHQFTDAFEYAEALSEWSAEQALINRDKQEAERKANEARQKMLNDWQTRLDATKSELADYDDMVASSDVQVSDAVRDAILESDVGPRILYHLAENPEIAEKLNASSTISALRQIGKLEAQFEKKKLLCLKLNLLWLAVKHQHL